MKSLSEWAVICFVVILGLSVGGCGSEKEKKDPVNPAGVYSLSFSNRTIGNALGACAVSPTNPDTASIPTLQSGGYTWTQGTLTVNTGTMTCTPDNCTAAVILDGMLNFYRYAFNVTITSNGMSGTLKQHGAACDDTYTVTGTKQ